MHRPVRLVLLLAVATLATACSPAGSSSPTPDPAAASAFLIRTAKAQPQACMDALLTGKLARNPASGLGVTPVGSPPVAVEWPFRYSAREVDGRIALIDATGSVVAQEGEMVQMGGGLGQLNVWFTCGPVERLAAVR
jgi:hypothetical protein